MLFTHVVSSVGWLGVEATMLALGIIGLLSGDPTVVASAYVIAGVLGGIFYLPASALALASGIMLGLGTKWGLIRHYWVAAKLVINVVLLLGGNLLLIPQFVAVSEKAASGAPVDIQIMLVSAMTAGLTLLLVATLLSTFTPWGRTPAHPARRPA